MLQQQVVAFAAREARRAGAPPAPTPPQELTLAGAGAGAEGGGAEAAASVEYVKWDGTRARAAVQRTGGGAAAGGACFASVAEAQVRSRFDLPPLRPGLSSSTNPTSSSPPRTA